MTKLQKTTFIIIIILFAGCKKQINVLNFEKNVMVEIFPSLIDSLWVSSQITMMPPPILFNEKKEFIGYGKRNIEEIKRNLNLELIEIKKDTSKILVEILEENIPIRNDDEQKELIKHFKNIEISKDINDTLKNKIDKRRLNLYKNLKIFYTKSSPRTNAKWEYLNLYKIYGTVSISRITFDKKKEFGVISIGVYRYYDGNGYRVFIKKVKNKWIVDKIEESWIT